MKPVGEPDAGNLHVRFDERGVETERWPMAPSHRASPRLYPYKIVHYVESKEYRPLFAALGQGVARIPVFSLPPKRGGRRADKAHCPDYSGRVSGLLRTMRCIANAPPRLAARQRGILAFKPLTVVGPGRLLVAGEAARVRPGDGGCVSHPLAGAAPAPRRQDASGRRPS
jgi:hypothetical protein